MIQLTTEQIEKYVNQYFDEMIAKDSNYIGNCDSSWIYDATDWLCMREEFQQDYIHEDSVREFANYSRVIWNKMYNDLYAYDDYSNIIRTLAFDHVTELQRICYPAKEILCSENYTKHLTKEQLTKREELFTRINSHLAPMLKDLNELSKELTTEKTEQ
jgi:5-methylthioribose kinase